MHSDAVMEYLKSNKLAAARYEQEGHHQFRDCVTFCRNGKLYFERYCYGEAASLVFSLWGSLQDDKLVWDMEKCSYSKKEEAPKAITAAEGERLQLDDGRVLWEPVRNYKTYPKAGLGFLRMLFAKK